MEFVLQNVSLASINPADRTFIITTNSEVMTLKSSIHKVGLLNPPTLVFMTSKGYYRIVCGYRRITALIKLGWQETPARIISSHPTEKEILLVSFFDNLSHRHFNPIEQAAIITRLLVHYKEDTIISDFLPLLGLPPIPRTLDQLKSLSNLTKQMQSAFLNGALSGTAAIKLSGLKPGDRRSLFTLLSRVKLSSSKQAEILENCLDITRKERISVRDILHDVTIEHILQQDKLTLSQKGDRIRAWFRKRRFPRLSQREERFVRLKKKLGLPRGVSLSPPPCFEGGFYRLQIEFENMEDLRQKTDRVSSFTDSPILQKILEDQG